MVRRVGVGATAASAVIFSVLLLSNIIVFVAAQGREAHYAQADAEDSLADEATVLMGAGGTNLLLDAQLVLGSRTFGCDNPSDAAARLVDALSDVQSFGGLTARTVPVAEVNVTAGDNMSMVVPFNGSRAGDFDIALAISIAGHDAATGVLYNRTEDHLVHLPVRLDRMASDCKEALNALSAAVAASDGTNCTSAAVAPVIDGANEGRSAEAASDGFSYGLRYSVAAGASCAVTFVVSVEQPGIQGPGGMFSVKMQGEGSASFSPPASP